MNTIKIADATLCRTDSNFSFKEKLEIARQLERLSVDTIEFPEIVNEKTDIMLIRTALAFVKSAKISVAAGIAQNSVENAISALSTDMGIVRIELPVSPVGMEYTCHKKAPKMLEYIKKCIETVTNTGLCAEFCALDATRAEKEFLFDAIKIAADAGAAAITLCDNAGNMMPNDFAEFVKSVSDVTDIPVGIACDNINGLATACAAMAVKNGATTVKTSVGGNNVPLDVFQNMVNNCGNTYEIATNLRHTELRRIIKQINWIADNAKSADNTLNVSFSDADFKLDVNDTKEDVCDAVKKLGYDLSAEDEVNVYNEFLRVAAKKAVTAKELEAVVASTALQVPPAYKLKTYVINNGNIITSSAQITVQKDEQEIKGISMGDGPIDAAFLALESIFGRHYELDDFQIQSVTEGKEAMGSALVKIRFNGKLYSGNGISTDIIGASIRAYLGAVNKIVYEED